MRRIVWIFALAAAVAVLASMLPSPVLADPGEPQSACATCHAREFSEWASSPHAGAGQSDVFRGLMDASDGRQADWPEGSCLQCHAPANGSDTGLPGVSCQVCHLIQSVDGIGNGAFTLASDGFLCSGTASQTPHQTAASELLSDSRLCAACHEQFHPVTGVPLQTTYSEWLNSASAAKGQTCQDCHMRGADGVSHASGTADIAAKVQALARAISLDVKSPETVIAGRQAVLEVLLLNQGAGHALPTGKNESGEMWLEFSAKTADGALAYEDRLSYAVTYNDSEGKHDSPMNLWDAASVFTDRRLMPGRAAEEQFAFAVPVGARGDIQVDVALMYRAVPTWLSEQLSLPLAAAAAIHRSAVTVRVLEPSPAPTYVAPTPLPTAIPLATTSSGGSAAGVKADDLGWVAPFLGAGALLLTGIGAWALRRRAV